MMNIHNLSISFQGEYLFEDITFKLGNGDRVGLIGKNGAGKSTMLKILSKEMEPDSGQIAADKELKIGFLKQDIDFVLGRTVLEEAYEAFTEIKQLEAKMEAVNTQMAERTDYESEGYHQLMVDINELQHQYEILGGYNYQGDTEKILQGLGFKREDFNMLTDTFSGGWRMRIELAKLLLQNNDILLLDEPTNHLDIESIIWLEGFLKNYPGAVVIVSHDKMFLDNVTNRTIEISLGKIYDYKYHYSKYLVQRSELKEKQLQAQKNQDKEIQRTEQLISKFRAKANKASMAQSLIKKLNKVERIEVDADDNAVMKVRCEVYRDAISAGEMPASALLPADCNKVSGADRAALDSVAAEETTVVRKRIRTKVISISDTNEIKANQMMAFFRSLQVCVEKSLCEINISYELFQREMTSYLNSSCDLALKRDEFRIESLILSRFIKSLSKDSEIYWNTDTTRKDLFICPHLRMDQ